jgi:TonB family protein
VVYVEVLKSLDPRLDQAAVEAARKMRFKPALRDGVPVQIRIPYSFVFVLE